MQNKLLRIASLAQNSKGYPVGTTAPNSVLSLLADDSIDVCDQTQPVGTVECASCDLQSVYACVGRAYAVLGWESLQQFAELRAQSIFFCFQPFWAEQLPRLQFLSDCLGTYLILLALKIRSQWSPSSFVLVSK
jgi:hypothetical protein